MRQWVDCRPYHTPDASKPCRAGCLACGADKQMAVQVQLLVTYWEQKYSQLSHEATPRCVNMVLVASHAPDITLKCQIV